MVPAPGTLGHILRTGLALVKPGHTLHVVPTGTAFSVGSALIGADAKCGVVLN